MKYLVCYYLLELFVVFYENRRNNIYVVEKGFIRINRIKGN